MYGNRRKANGKMPAQSIEIQSDGHTSPGYPSSLLFTMSHRDRSKSLLNQVRACHTNDH